MACCERHAADGEEANPTTNVGGVEVKRCFLPYQSDDYGSWFKGRVKGETASFAASNNSDNLISGSLVQRLQLPTTKCTPFVLETSGGTIQHGGDTMVQALEVELDGGFVCTMDFAVVPNLPLHDVLLGWPFFIQAGMVEFCADRKVRIGEHLLQIHSGRP